MFRTLPLMLSSVLAASLLLAPIPAQALSVEFFSVNGGTDRVENQLDGPTAYRAGFDAEGSDLSSVSVQLPDSTVVDLEMTSPGEWERSFFFSSLAEVEAFTPSGSYTFTFNGSESVAIDFVFRGTEEYAADIELSGNGFDEVDSIDWSCTSNPCNGGQGEFFVVMTDLAADIDIVDESGLPIDSETLATPGLVIDPGAAYRVEVDITQFGDFQNPMIGGNPSQYASFYSSDNAHLINVVPEPAVLWLVAAGLLAVIARRR